MAKNDFFTFASFPAEIFLTLKQPLPIKSSFVIPPCLWVFTWCRFSPRDALKIFCWCLGNHLSIKSGFEKSSCGFPDSSVGKESACNAGDPSSIPGLGRSAGEGIGYPLQYSGLENSMDYSPWTHKERTWLSDFHLTCGLWRERPNSYTALHSQICCKRAVIHQPAHGQY